MIDIAQLPQRLRSRMNCYEEKKREKESVTLERRQKQAEIKRQAFLEWTVQKAANMSSPAARKKMCSELTGQQRQAIPAVGEETTKKTPNSSSRRRLLFDNTNLIINDKTNNNNNNNNKINADIVHRKLKRAEELHALYLQTRIEKAHLFNTRHEKIVEQQKHLHSEEMCLQKQQMLEQKLRNAELKRSYFTFRKGIRAKCGVQQSPEKALERLRQIRRLERVQRLWRVYLETKVAAESIARRLNETLSLEIARKSANYDDFVLVLQNEKVLADTHKFLERLETRLVMLGDNENIATKSQIKIMFPPTKNIASLRRRRSRGVDDYEEGNNNNPSRFPTRIVLCAYMICAHPEMVLGGGGDDAPYEEKTLRSASARLVESIDETIARAIVEDTKGTKEHDFNEAVLQFAILWDEYAVAFAKWKTNDAISLEAELVRVAVAMEASCLRKCATSSSSSSNTTSDDIDAIREQTGNDLALLRTKVRELAGEVGVLRFDDAIRATRESIRAEIEQVNNVSGSPSSLFEERRSQRLFHSEQLLREKEEAGKRLMQSKSEDVERLQIMHELLADIKWTPFSMVRNNNRAGEEKDSLQFRVKAQATKAFWDLFKEKLEEKLSPTTIPVVSPPVDSSDFTDDDIVSANIRELFMLIHSLVPESWKSVESKTRRALDLLNEKKLLATIIAQKDTFTSKVLLQKTLESGFTLLVALGSEARESETKLKFDSLISAFEGNTSLCLSEMVVLSLQFLWEIALELKEDISKGKILVAVERLRHVVAGGNHPSESTTTAYHWIQDSFSNLYSLDVTSVEDALPRTKKWIFKSACEFAPVIETSGLNVIASTNNNNNNIPENIRAGLKNTSYSLKNSSTNVKDEEVVDWSSVRASSIEGVVRLMFVDLVCHREEHQELPETLRFDSVRIHDAQDSFQRLLLACACLALVEQMRPNAVGVSLTSELKAELNARVLSILRDEKSTLKDVATEVARTIGSSSSQSLIERMLLKLVGAGGDGGYAHNSANVDSSEDKTRVGVITHQNSISEALHKNVREALAARVIGGKHGKDSMLSRLNNCRSDVVMKELDVLAKRVHAFAKTSFAIHVKSYSSLVTKAYETSEEL